MIRKLLPLDVNDELCRLGQKFYEQEKLPGEFIPQVFTNTWQTLMNMHMGSIWVAEESGKMIGAIGGCIHPDANDGRLVAQEMFWFVESGSRGGISAIKLFNEFESWAVDRGCARVVMGCILNDYAKSLRKFYMKHGYRPVDVSYFKVL